MAAKAVTHDGTRVNSADSNTNYGHWGGSGGAPGAEPQLRYQGTNCVNKKATGTGTSYNGIDYDPGSGAVDMTAVNRKLMMLKVYVADFGDLNTTFGVRGGIGSALANRYEYNIAGSGEKSNNGEYDTYPAQGGYIIVALNPSVAAWRDATVGTPVLTAVDWFGVQIVMITGGAKSENLGFDAIDIGRGLIIKGGDGADTDGVWEDFLDFDEGIINNRFGYVVSGPTVRGLLMIGSASEATEFDGPSTDVITYPDGYHGEGDVGVLVNLGHSGTKYADAATHIGKGSAGTEDTRPNYTFTGTTATQIAKITGNLQNFKDITLTSKAEVDAASIEAELLVQATAHIHASIIVTRSLTSIAFLQDPTFGATSGLHDNLFVQGGAGHAIEIDTAGTYVLTDLRFQGYGANASDSAAIDVTATSGTVTIQYTGPAPTYKTAGATVVLENTINTLIKGVPTGAEWRLYEEDATSGIIGSTELDGAESHTGGDITYADNYSSDTDVVLQVLADGYVEYLNYFILGDSPQTVNVVLIPETNE